VAFHHLELAAAHEVFAPGRLDRSRRLGHVLLVLLRVADLHVDNDVGGGHGGLLLV
jgi:hypothetical protein